MAKYLEQYDHLWSNLQGDDRAIQTAVGGDFEAMGLLEFELLRWLGLDASWSVVDVGCGSGRLAKRLADHGQNEYVGTDILQPLLDHAQKICNRRDWIFRKTDGQSIPAPDNSADLVCFFSVFTHITQEETWRYLLEAKRVLKPEGMIVCSFLEFRIRSHWGIFREDIKDPAPEKILNQFMGRDAFEAFAFNAGLTLQSVFDGDQPVIPISEELIFENGHRLQGLGNLGQSVCVMRKPLHPTPLPD